MTAADTHASIETVWRAEAGKLIAALTRISRDVGLAEDLAQDAMVAALEQWPAEGIPRNPGAWLMTAAKRRAIDRLRRGKIVDRAHGEIAVDLQALERALPDFDATLDEEIGDDLLRLMFVACHPALPLEARVPLTLRLLGGLTTDEIARAFLVPEKTIAQRIVRAKRTIADKQLPFEIPDGAARAERLTAVLHVVYLIFNEGYSASAGDDVVRPGLCDEALRLGRLLAGLVPEDAEVHGLLALMELQASRSTARVDADGNPVLLLEQDRSRWDAAQIARGLAALDCALALASAAGPYVLQAAIAACHARAADAGDTDWAQIARLYAVLELRMPTPVIALNRAMAVSMAEGPAAGLALVDALRDEPSLARYHRLPAARGDLLFKLGRLDEARIEFDRAAALADNAREREFLRRRVAECGPRDDR